MERHCACTTETTLPARQAVCCVVPAHVVARVAESGAPEEREAAVRTMAASASARGRRSVVTSLMQELHVGLADLTFMTAAAGNRFTVYDAGTGGAAQLPGIRSRGTGDEPVDDQSVNEAYQGAELTDRFFENVFGRDSIDGRGAELISSVHYGRDFDNAMWNGVQMIYGDGSGYIMARGSLTKALDIIGHELAHGLTQMTAGLLYRKQSGALNESFSDVFGTLVKQYSRGQSVDEADWLVGEGVLGSALQGRALRSMENPGTAFNMDRQPGHMRDYVDLPDDNDPRNDNGGVHINSGIPNRAFYLAASALGGHAWEKAGRIWYTTLTHSLRPDSEFAAAGEATVAVAGELFGEGGLEQRAVRAAWQAVGVL